MADRTKARRERLRRLRQKLRRKKAKEKQQEQADASTRQRLKQALANADGSTVKRLLRKAGNRGKRAGLRGGSAGALSINQSSIGSRARANKARSERQEEQERAERTMRNATAGPPIDATLKPTNNMGSFNYFVTGGRPAGEGGDKEMGVRMQTDVLGVGERDNGGMEAFVMGGLDRADAAMGPADARDRGGGPRVDELVYASGGGGDEDRDGGDDLTFDDTVLYGGDR